MLKHKSLWKILVHYLISTTPTPLSGLEVKVVNFEILLKFGISLVKVFSSPEHELLKMSYCDGYLSVVCPSVLWSVSYFFK